MGIEFEYDRDKSRINHDKHGIDFEQAEQLWEDDDLTLIDARTVGELRMAMIAKMHDKHWTTIYTYRSARIRIISVRRSRREEIALYEQEEKNN